MDGRPLDGDFYNTIQTTKYKLLRKCPRNSMQPLKMQPIINSDLRIYYTYFFLYNYKIDQIAKC